MNKLGLIIGLILSVIGIYFIDKNILLSFEMNQSKWVGRYIFFGAYHILILWVLYALYKKFEGILKILMPLLFGGIILFLGLILGG